MIFWEPVHASSPFFGTYYYHGNAGAFLNLVLPVITAFALRAFHHPKEAGWRAIWFPALLVCVAAAMVNVSRAATFISILLLVAMAFFEWWERGTRYSFVPGRMVAGAIALSCVVLWAVSISAGSFQAWEKWSWLKHQWNEENPRYIVASICLGMAKDSGFWGFGPGAFEIAFPHYTGSSGTAIRGVWHYAHQDYLQTLIEWGWIGAAAWMTLLFGGIVKSFRAGTHTEPDSRLRVACGLALVGIALHALVDFPLQIASLQLYTAAFAGIAWARADVVKNFLISPKKGALRNNPAGQLAISSALPVIYCRESAGIRVCGSRDQTGHSRRWDSSRGVGRRNRH